MKYCSKCGNELLDEAVICPKCGCPVEGSTNKADS
ncbi:zinc-ribbon domain-containing protein, partial [Intestinimonas butyriciproducens]